MDITIGAAKTAARILRVDLRAAGLELSHSAALELVAHQLGFPDWNTASALLRSGDIPRTGTPVPVLRVQDVTIARTFYRDYLGFSTEWQHQFEPGLPVYTRIVRDRARLDLSEHHGDGTPGSVVWIPIDDARALHAELTAKNHPRLRPGIDGDAPGGPTIDVIDPFGNALRFCQVSDGA